MSSLASFDFASLPEVRLERDDSSDGHHHHNSQHSASQSTAATANTAELVLWHQYHRNHRTKADVTVLVNDLVARNSWADLVALCRVAFMSAPPLVKRAAHQPSTVTDLIDRGGADVAVSDLAMRALLVIRAVTDLMEADRIILARAEEIVNIFRGNFHCLTDIELVTVVGSVLHSVNLDTMKTKNLLIELLPKSLTELRKYNRVRTHKVKSDALSEEETPATFQRWVVDTLVKKALSQASLVALIERLSDLDLEVDENNMLVKRFVEQLRTLDRDSEVPAAVYQLCRIKRLDKRLLWTHLLKMFAMLEEQSLRQSSLSSGTYASQSSQSNTDSYRDGTLSRSLLACESMVLVSLNESISHDPFLGEVLIYIVGNREVPFTSFVLATLLSMTNIHRFHAKILTFLHKFILEELLQQSQQRESAALNRAFEPFNALTNDLDGIFHLFLRHIESFPEGQIGLMKLGMALIDTRCVAAKPGTSAQLDTVSLETFDCALDPVNRTPQMNAVNLGGKIIWSLFQHNPSAWSPMLESLLARLRLASNAASAASGIAAVCSLHRIIERTDHRGPLIAQFRPQWQEAIDDIAELSITVSLPFVDVMLLLLQPSYSFNPEQQHHAQHLHDYLLLAVKKACFLPSTDARVFACLGLVAFIRAALRGADDGYNGGSSSLSQSTAPNIDRRLISELLALIRRSMMSESSVRSKLYASLFSLFHSYPVIRGPILSMLLAHFAHFYIDSEDSAIPFRLSACVRLKRILEPIDDLVQTVVQCLGLIKDDNELIADRSVAGQWLSEDEAVQGRASVMKLRECLRGTLDRLKQCSNKDLDIDPAVPFAALQDTAKHKLLHGLLQSALVYAIQTAPDKKVTDSMWTDCMTLFAVFNKLDAWMTGAAEKSQSRSKSRSSTKPKNGGQKGDGKAADDGSDEEEEYEDHESESSTVASSVTSPAAASAARARSRSIGAIASTGAPSSTKRKLSLYHLLPAIFVHASFHKLVAASNEKPLLSTSVPFQRWLIPATEAVYEDFRAKGAAANVQELVKLCRCLWVYSTKLYEGVAKEAAERQVEKEKGKIKSLFALAAHTLAKCIENTARHGQTIATTICRDMAPNRTKLRIADEQGEYPQCWSVPCLVAMDDAVDWLKQLLAFNRHRDAEAAVAVLEALRKCSEHDFHPHALQRRQYLARQVAECLQTEIGSPSTVRALCFLVFRMTAEEFISREIAEELAKDLWLVLGSIDESRRELPREPAFKAVNEKCSSAVVNSLCGAVQRWIEDADALHRRAKHLRRTELDMGDGTEHKDKRRVAGDTGLSKPRAQLVTEARRGLDQSSYSHLTAAVTVLDLLAQCELSNREVDDLARTATRAFKLLNAVAAFVASNGPDPGQTLAELIAFSLSEFCVHANAFIAHVALTAKEESESRIVRSKKLLPELSYAVSAFEATCIRLSKSPLCKRDFTSLIRRTKQRDVRFELKRARSSSESSTSDSDESSSEEEDQHRKKQGRKRDRSPQRKTRGVSKSKSKPRSDMKRERSENSDENDENRDGNARRRARSSSAQDKRKSKKRRRPAFSSSSPSSSESSSCDSASD